MKLIFGVQVGRGSRCIVHTEIQTEQLRWLGGGRFAKIDYFFTEHGKNSDDRRKAFRRSGTISAESDASVEKFRIYKNVEFERSAI